MVNNYSTTDVLIILIHKSNLNDAICLFYDQTCAIQTRTDCLVAFPDGYPWPKLLETVLHLLKHCHNHTVCKNSTRK